MQASRQRYLTDLTNAEWAAIEPLLPPPGWGGRPVSVDRREIVNAILYYQRAGLPWRMLPHDLPAWKTVYHYYRWWRIGDDWVRVEQKLKSIRRYTDGD